MSKEAYTRVTRGLHLAVVDVVEDAIAREEDDVAADEGYSHFGRQVRCVWRRPSQLCMLCVCVCVCVCVRVCVCLYHMYRSVVTRRASDTQGI